MRSVYNLRRECEEYRLAGREILHDKSNEQLSRWYNGAGPDSWLPEARGILTAAMGLYEPAILIHDVQFEHSDGTDEGFRKTIADWKENTARILEAEYPLWTLRMLNREYRLARGYWHAVKLAADRAIATDAAKAAWLAAYNKHHLKGKEKQMKRTMIMIALTAALTVILTGCLAPTKTVVMEYDASGAVVKKTTTSESVVKTLTASTAGKTVIAWESGWAAYLSASTATSDDPTPTVKMFAGKTDKGMISAQPDQQNWDGIAAAIHATKYELTVTADGMTNSGAAQK